MKKKYRYCIAFVILLLIYCIFAFLIRKQIMINEEKREYDDICKIELLKDTFKQIVDAGMLDEYIYKYIGESENIKIDFGNIRDLPDNNLKKWYTEVYSVMGNELDNISPFHSMRLNNDKDEKNIYILIDVDKNVKVYISNDSINTVSCEFCEDYFER